MNSQWNSLVDHLATALSRVSAPESHSTLADSVPAATVDPKRTTAIVNKLLSQALENGLPFSGEPTLRPLSGGNTALQVSTTSAQVHFVFKMDTATKLVREARVIQDLGQDPGLGSFSRGLPKIYALHAESSPYAYLMEWFDPKIYRSLKEIFFDPAGEPRSDHGKDLGEHAVDALAEAYRNSKDDRLQVRMMGEAYFRRMEENLVAAARHSKEFESAPLVINGVKVAGWRGLLDRIAARKTEFQALAPPFMTVVHGDPNPGNILVKREGPDIREVKFIDLKEWKFGDYLFDIAKLTHFLQYTGPLEELHAFSDLHVERAEDGIHFTYKFSVPTYVAATVDAIKARASNVAGELGDPTWELRYRLAMASNVLGLLNGRLKINFVDPARIFYAEGMLLLQDFVDRWT